MTAVDERGLAKCFDNFEPPEGVKAELLRGVVVMMAGPDLVHNLIALHTQRQIPLERWYPIQTQDVSIAGEDSVPVPDLVVAAPDALPGSGRLLPSELITAVVEIVSKPKFGDPVRLEALGVELDTSEFGTLPEVRPHRYP
ncbi:Uma2 family endonuclease [Streptomyces sp. NPDC093018]|uniref:Uma2 family endonuclease n=1 Tax=Streptomyces sp. NPDC093018 TaxID=3155067 RepID=UPI00341309DC